MSSNKIVFITTLFNNVAEREFRLSVFNELLEVRSFHVNPNVKPLTLGSKTEAWRTRARTTGILTPSKSLYRNALGLELSQNCGHDNFLVKVVWTIVTVEKVLKNRLAGVMNIEAAVLDLTELFAVVSRRVIQRTNLNFHGENISKNLSLSS